MRAEVVLDFYLGDLSDAGHGVAERVPRPVASAAKDPARLIERDLDEARIPVKAQPSRRQSA